MYIWKYVKTMNIDVKMTEKNYTKTMLISSIIVSYLSSGFDS